MRKSFVIVLFGVFAAFALLYGVWWMFPKARNTEIVAEAHRVTEERLEAIRSQADDAEVNGFLNPTFVPYWGRMGIEQKDGSSAQKTVRAWQEYSTASADERVDHKTLQEQSDEGYSTALEGMMAMAPELRKAMNKPLFAPPKSEHNAAAVIPNIIAARACAQAMVGLAESEIARGQLDQAALDLVSIINFGSGFNGQGTLFTDMAGISIQAIGLDGFNGLIDINSGLSADTWKTLAASVLKTVPPKDTLLSSLQGEMLYVHNSIELVHEDPEIVEEAIRLSPLAHLPGFYDREERIYNNVMSDIILQHQKNGTLEPPKEFFEPSAMDQLTGRSGVLAVLMLSDPVRANRRILLSRSSQIATATALGIAAYRAQEGKLPESLAQLSQAGIPVTEETDFLDSMEYSVQADTATLKVPVQEQPDESISQTSRYGEHPWLKRDAQFLTYSFGRVNDDET